MNMSGIKPSQTRFISSSGNGSADLPFFFSKRDKCRIFVLGLVLVWHQTMLGPPAASLSGHAWNAERTSYPQNMIQTTQITVPSAVWNIHEGNNQLVPEGELLIPCVCAWFTYLHLLIIFTADMSSSSHPSSAVVNHAHEHVNIPKYTEYFRAYTDLGNQCVWQA